MLAGLKSFLDRASEEYYLGHPIISDETFDKLAESCNYSKVGYDISKGVAHYFQLYSLNKFYEDFPILPGPSVETPKVDGACISLLYVNGALVQGATRGDGLIGEDITDKVNAWKEIPKHIQVTGIVQVSGEVSTTCRPNARNYAAGALNLKSVEEFLSRELYFIAHDVQGFDCGTYESNLLTLKDCGFKVVTDIEEDKFPLDGRVVRINDTDEFYKQGYTSQFPKGAYAKKVRKEGIATTLKEVRWQVGAGGKVTPVALFEPVDIDGAVVQKATLHNAGFVEAMQLSIGDTILIVRAGEIIPQVIGKI